ncbi:IS66 family transposase [Ruminococcus albus]|uniref:Putative transposase n=1 Tax=Ruminococcus albus (strain ATCC 27210 / DSM 20455 / JCM 14654 / NCDO 2250 / 7) TaxID=697329 RepID=E6UFM6_RUMA7|nr:IS66 family transposase [Ruminococcus albus]ADU21930.1 putative transposase [Ruminococcus albus 7 = DSM 20455]
MSELNSVKNDMTMAQENAALRSRVAVLEEELAFVQEQLTWLKKQVFGRKTEQSSVILDNCTQLSLFPEEEKPQTQNIAESVTVPEHKRRKKRTHDDWMETMDFEIVEHKEDHPVCENCGSEMKEIGQEKAYDELVYTPAKFHVRRHIVYTYKCPECGEKPENDADHSEDIERCNIRRAEYPKPMIPGSFCSPELLAHIIYEKYAKAVPLHRQEKDLASKHIPLLKATMSNWVCTAAEKWCMPIVQEMHRLLLCGDVVHADETRIQVLHEEGRKATAESKMWVYCNGKMNDRSIVIFDYKPTRKGKNAQAFLKGFDGYLVRDGYSGYHVVTGVKHCGCMTHARRYFVNALPKDKSAQETSIAAEAVRYFERIYHEENLLSGMTAEKRYEQRLAKVKPLLDAFFAWLETLQVSGKSALAKAVAYALNEKPYLYTFLENGNVPIDNNRAENAIRPFAVGRKNWMHSNTANGAKASAALYSIVATAQANGLNTEQYLTELFSQPAGTILLPFTI